MVASGHGFNRAAQVSEENGFSNHGELYACSAPFQEAGASAPEVASWLRQGTALAVPQRSKISGVLTPEVGTIFGHLIYEIKDGFQLAITRGYR